MSIISSMHYFEKCRNLLYKYIWKRNNIILIVLHIAGCIRMICQKMCIVLFSIMRLVSLFFAKSFFSFLSNLLQFIVQVSTSLPWIYFFTGITVKKWGHNILDPCKISKISLVWGQIIYFFEENIRLDINRVSSFSKCNNGPFPWRNYTLLGHWYINPNESSNKYKYSLMS